MKNKIILPLVGLLPFYLSACCDLNTHKGLSIYIDSLPKQNTITMYGLKEGKALEKKQLVYSQNNNYYNNSAVFYFEPSVNVVDTSSTIVVEYTNLQQKITKDTITITYKTQVEYEQGCGAYLSIRDWKIAKNTSKPPHTIKIN